MRINRWHFVLAPMALIFALPLIWLTVSSFMTNAQINTFPPKIIPDGLHLDGYRYVFRTGDFGHWFLNSTIVAVVTVASNLVFCSFAGYAFARMRFRGSKSLLALMLATLVVPFQLTMIPTFLLMKKLGLIDSLGALILPSLVTPFGWEKRAAEPDPSAAPVALVVPAKVVTAPVAMTILRIVLFMPSVT